MDYYRVFDWVLPVTPGFSFPKLFLNPAPGQPGPGPGFKTILQRVWKIVHRVRQFLEVNFEID